MCVGYILYTISYRIHCIFFVVPLSTFYMYTHLQFPCVVHTLTHTENYSCLLMFPSQDSGISSGEREGSPGGHRQCECPFIEPAEGWSVEYSHKNCEVSLVGEREECM